MQILNNSNVAVAMYSWFTTGHNDSDDNRHDSADVACSRSPTGNKELSQSHLSHGCRHSTGQRSGQHRDSQPIGFLSLGNSNCL